VFDLSFFSPSASNMAEMASTTVVLDFNIEQLHQHHSWARLLNLQIWDPELHYLAQKSADQCNVPADDCSECRRVCE
jgi:hypothetical protein